MRIENASLDCLGTYIQIALGLELNETWLSYSQEEIFLKVSNELLERFGSITNLRFKLLIYQDEFANNPSTKNWNECLALMAAYQTVSRNTEKLERQQKHKPFDGHLG